MTEGYVKALKTIHDVTNLSLGRVSCIYHIKVILERRLEIESCDLLILDHYINDINKYIKFFGEKHFDYCKDLYALLSTLNVNIINILFPILNIDTHVNVIYYKKILEITSYLKIESIDLNIFFNKPEFFKDKLHLKADLSFKFGVWLNNKIAKVYWGKPKNGLVIENPYFSMKPLYLDKKNKKIIKNYSNSLIDIDYLEIKSDFSLTTNTICDLIAIGYIKEFNECQGLNIAGERVVLSRDGYLVELLDQRINCSSIIYIAPLVEYGSYYALGNREYVTGQFSGAKVVELIFKTNNLIKVIPAKREVIDLFLDY